MLRRRPLLPCTRALRRAACCALSASCSLDAGPACRERIQAPGGGHSQHSSPNRRYVGGVEPSTHSTQTNRRCGQQCAGRSPSVCMHAQHVPVVRGPSALSCPSMRSTPSPSCAAWQLGLAAHTACPCVCTCMRQSPGALAGTTSRACPDSTSGGDRAYP